MEIQTGAIQSYQKNQNLSGWVQQNEAISGQERLLKSSDPSKEDTVSLSTRSKIFEWIAQEFPHMTQESADINRASHMLYEYQILDIDDVKTVNSILTTQPNTPFLSSIQQKMDDTQSFSELQQLRHLNQVFSTLAAAEKISAA